MAKSQLPSFVFELPLVVLSRDERVLLGRFEAGRRLYNEVLQDALARLNARSESGGCRRQR